MVVFLIISIAMAAGGYTDDKKIRNHTIPTELHADGVISESMYPAHLRESLSARASKLRVGLGKSSAKLR